MAILNFLRPRSTGGHAGLPALATCRSLLGLLAGLQQHRGLSSGCLAGDSRFEARMLQRRHDIEGLLPGLAPAFLREGEEACPCFAGNDWKLFRFHWQELLEQLPGSASDANVERHNRLIAQLLEWLAALGEVRLELPFASHLDPQLARNFAARLPALAECLGQARALGSAVAVRGGCTPVARVRLGFLLARAETLLAGAAAGCAGEAAAAAPSLVRAMAEMVRRDLLRGSELRISSETYFAAASRAIDAVFAWIEASGDSIERDLRNAPLAAALGAGWRPAFG